MDCKFADRQTADIWNFPGNISVTVVDDKTLRFAWQPPIPPPKVANVPAQDRHIVYIVFCRCVNINNPKLLIFVLCTKNINTLMS